MTVTSTAKTELEKWKQAAEDSRNVLSFYEKRLDRFKAENRALKARIKDLEGAR